MSANEDLLARYLADRDAACPGCGYNVRGLSSAVCPECGKQIELTIGLVQPKQGGLIAGLIGLSAGAGFAGFLLFYWLIVALFVGNNFGGPKPRIVILSVIGLVAHGLALLAWIGNSNRIRIASASARAVMIAACWLMPLSYMLILAMMQ